MKDPEEKFMQEEIKKTGYTFKHCCMEMTYHLATASTIDDKNDGDIIIDFDEQSKSYGIPIHDGGSSWIQINNCPWCGSKF